MHISSLLLAVLAGLVGVHGHGLVTKPATRTPGDATAAVCGKTLVSFYKQDNTSYPEALMRARGLSDKDYDAARCNIYLCKGFQFADNRQQVQSYEPGQEVAIEVYIRIPHRGYANVSIVDTTTNAVLGTPLLRWPDGYAASLSPPRDQTHFHVTIPDTLGDRCTVAGQCVIQWYWLGQGQTYESCIDFTTPTAAKTRMFRA